KNSNLDSFPTRRSSDLTSEISSIIEQTKLNQHKAICFVTGVPGAGKTLVGLKVATTQLEKQQGSESVYLSGNGPLVAILQEALRSEEHTSELQSRENLI